MDARSRIGGRPGTTTRSAHRTFFSNAECSSSTFESNGTLYQLSSPKRFTCVRLISFHCSNEIINSSGCDRNRDDPATITWKALNCLSQLDDLSLITWRIDRGIFESDSISLPLLKRFRLVGIKYEDLINDEPSNPILQLAIHVFPSLQLLSVGPRADPRPDLQIAFISWRRNNEADAEFPSKFAPETVDCMVQSASFQPTEQDRRILSKTRHLRLCCDQECSNTINGIWAILENATAISTLVLCAHKTETATNALAALQRVSGSIEEMQLILPSWNDKGRWGGLGSSSL